MLEVLDWFLCIELAAILSDGSDTFSWMRSVFDVNLIPFCGYGYGYACMCVLELIVGVLHEGVFVELSLAWGFGLVFVG